MNRLTKALGIGVLLAVIGVGLFLGIYIALGSAPAATRLFSALIIPPLVMGLLIGSYYLFIQSQDNESI